VETGTSFQEPAIFLLTSDPKSSYKPKSILLLRGLSSVKEGIARTHSAKQKTWSLALFIRRPSRAPKPPLYFPSGLMGLTAGWASLLRFPPPLS